jgi:hypothetical protein
MCLQSGYVVVDLVEEHMVRIAVLEQHVELAAARLLYLAAAFSRIAGLNFSYSAGTMSSSTALM